MGGICWSRRFHEALSGLKILHVVVEHLPPVAICLAGMVSDPLEFQAKFSGRDPEPPEERKIKAGAQMLVQNFLRQGRSEGAARSLVG